MQLLEFLRRFTAQAGGSREACKVPLGFADNINLTPFATPPYQSILLFIYILYDCILSCRLCGSIHVPFVELATYLFGQFMHWPRQQASVEY